MPRDSPDQANAADLAEAYKEIQKGEQAAAALEANLSNLESKLDAILAAYGTNGASPTSLKQDSNRPGGDSNTEPRKEKE